MDIKRLENFDYAAQPAVDRRLIDELTTCRFLHDGRSIVFLGQPGVGKTSPTLLTLPTFFHRRFLLTTI